MSVLAVLGFPMALIASYDLLLWRVRSPDRYCVVLTFASAEQRYREFDVEVYDDGSGCLGPARCRVPRILLPDVKWDEPPDCI